MSLTNRFFFILRFSPILHLFTFQTPILVHIKYMIHFIIYFKIQECLGILTKNG